MAILAATGARTSNGWLFEPGCFLRAVVYHGLIADPIPLWVSHRPVTRAGHVTELRELRPGDGRLPVEFRRAGWGALLGTVTLTGDLGREAAAHLDRLALSIGPDTPVVKTVGGRRVVQQVSRLREVSLTYNPANPGAAILAR